MPKYTVLSGTHRREDGSVATEGDVVEMSEEQREMFSAMKFQQVEEESVEVEETETVSDEVSVQVDEAEPGPEPEPEPESEESEVEASGDLPDDYTVLRRMAMAYDGSEVHGSSAQQDIEEFFSTFSDTEVAELKRQAEEIAE